jgi:hypothetical protein
MEKHAGTLTLESELGKGTRALAAFPREAVIADAKPSRRATAGGVGEAWERNGFGTARGIRL